MGLYGLIDWEIDTEDIEEEMETEENLKAAGLNKHDTFE